MQYGLLLLAIAAGFMLPIQGALNARLGGLMEHPMQATLISYIGGLIACLLVLFFVQRSVPEIRKLTEINWYLYCGGFLGAVFVSAMLYLMPRIGIANMLAAAIVGQLIMSTVLDHFGALGNPQIPVNSSRIIGIVLLLAGLYFIQRSRSVI
ncbi:DMT family transporter [Aliamphritea hakodatensis]|uniref:DMT family transporter n=1 Tax=Aliamphritea hakodatensis TaxID=2895352 RepID=UPI0022FDACA6|nr:DMT family transporter [Aliamphritea hakodatensis]